MFVTDRIYNNKAKAFNKDHFSLVQLRVARHTTDIKAIKKFYIHFLGLELLGEFQGHDDYDGFFIGREGLDWHLEFTVAAHVPIHKADDDDLLVFYPGSMDEVETIIDRSEQLQIKATDARNPYWTKKGMTFLDPDGFGVVVVKPE